MIFRYLPGLAILFICACNPTQKSGSEGQRPNIVWINAEDISPALGAYGDSLAITPNIDALAREGIVFNRAYAVSPICSPSRSTLVTGIQATSLGTQHLRSETPFPSELSTLPVIMREAGYFTSIYGKTDYNFSPEGLWDYWNNDEAPWRQRVDDRPFLSVFTLNHTHEGKGNSLENYRQEIQKLPAEMRHQPGSIEAPPYYPQTEESRDLWTRYYDLVTVFDQSVGRIIDQLRQDDELDNTIIFIFSDHGFGMPRYKRWLNETGLRVPLIVYIPQQYQHLSTYLPGTVTNDLISFIDFVPTALALAGIEQPKSMQGHPFLGVDTPHKNEDLFAFRSRADNMYEMSRAVRDRRYLYIRHYMPHLPYIQASKIFADDKDSYRMLWRMYRSGELGPESLRMFEKKPVEELYDLENDPYELVNLASDPQHEHVLNRLRSRLKSYVLETKDLGYLYESEMVLRAGGKPPYYLRNNKDLYDIERLFDAAEKVGKAGPDEIIQLLQQDDSSIQFWGIMGIHQYNESVQRSFIPVLKLLEKSVSPTIQIAAAELLYKLTGESVFLKTIIINLHHEVKEVNLQAARALEVCSPSDDWVIAEVKPVLQRYRAPEGSRFPYTDYNFASFISWSLESVVENTSNSNRKNIKR